MSLGNDARDIGQLLSYALRPKTRPGIEGEYGRLLRRYQDEMSFRDAFDEVLEGMQLRVLHAGDLGVVLTARRESVFAYRLASDQGSGNKTHNALRGLAHIGIAAYAYPHPDDLIDTTVRYVDIMAVEEFIRRACSQLRARADEIAQGGEPSDRVVDLALAAGLGALWSEWDQMQAIDIGTRGRGTGRISTKCTTYWVLRACKDLVDHGLARAAGKTPTADFNSLSGSATTSQLTPALRGTRRWPLSPEPTLSSPTRTTPPPRGHCPEGHLRGSNPRGPPPVTPPAIAVRTQGMWRRLVPR